jgi:hypothetical protein
MGFLDFLRPKKSEEKEQLDAAFKKMFQVAFPLGETQVESETDRLHFEMGGRLTRDDAKRLLLRVKTLLVLNSDREPAYLADYVFRTTDGKLSRDEARLTAEFVSSLAVGSTVASGSGMSAEDPVSIKAPTTMAGIRAEYTWLQKHFGERDRDWKLVMQSHGHRGEQIIETLQIELNDGSKREIYFDITDFYGKFA